MKPESKFEAFSWCVLCCLCTVRFWIWLVLSVGLCVYYAMNEWDPTSTLVLASGVIAFVLYLFPNQILSPAWRAHRAKCRSGAEVLTADVSFWKWEDFEFEITYSDGTLLRWINSGFNEDWMWRLAQRMRNQAAVSV